MEPFRTLLVAVHLGESAEWVCAHATRLAVALGAEVVLLAVVDRLFPDPAVLTVEEKAATHPAPEVSIAVEALLAGFRRHGVSARGLVRDGAPAARILEASDEVLADLVVLGTHARTGLQRLMLGSVAQEVVRSSAIPVTLVRIVPGAPIRASRP